VRTQHYAFLVDDASSTRLRPHQEGGLTYCAGPHKEQPGEINHHWGGRGVYFEDPNGHLLELITKPYGDLADLNQPTDRRRRCYDGAMSSRFALGALCIVGTVTIWAGWYVVIRFGMTSTSLDCQDLTALRFGVAGILCCRWCGGAARRSTAWAGRAAGDRAGRRRALRAAGRRRPDLRAGRACQRLTQGVIR
jgi:hypothetical protein